MGDKREVKKFDESGIRTHACCHTSKLSILKLAPLCHWLVDWWTDKRI